MRYARASALERPVEGAAAHRSNRHTSLPFAAPQILQRGLHHWTRQNQFRTSRRGHAYDMLAMYMPKCGRPCVVPTTACVQHL